MSSNPSPNGQKRTSLRTQMIVGSITTLTLVLVLFGLFVRYVVTTTLMNSVDHELEQRTERFNRPGPPPPQFQQFGQGDQQGQGQFGGPGNPGQGGPFGQGPPPGSDQFGDGQGGPGGPNGPDGFGGPNGPGDPNQQGFNPDQGGQGGPPPDQQFSQPGNPDGLPPPGNQTGENADTTIQRSQIDIFRPRHFTSDGAYVDRLDSTPAWDMAALKAASSNNNPIFTTVIRNGERLRVYTHRHMRRNRTSDFVQAVYPLSEVDSAIAGVDEALIILIPVALIIAAFGGFFVTKSVFDRVGQMVRSTSSINTKDLSQRIPVVGRDEFAELAESFNSLLQRVEIAFIEQAKIVEQQRRFTADASHELKTPLTVIRGTTSLALSGAGTLDRASTEDIDIAAASMADLVQDLIYLARSDAGQLGRDRISMLLIEPLEKAVSQVSKISSAPIKILLEDQNVELEADETELTRLFTNLIQNAAQHTPATGEITVKLTSAGKFAVVSIKDTGSGIASKHIPHLFERFYRIDSARSRSHGGSGLGLSICKGIVDANDGKIAITSQVGKGTEVIVQLPKK